MPYSMSDKKGASSQKSYSTAELFENWQESFSVYELYRHADGREDLKIVAANRTFAQLIDADYETLTGRLFTDACPMAMDWLPFYIQVAKTGQSNLHESYNQDLKKYLSALVFSPHPGEVAILVIDRTHLWLNDQALRARNKELAAIFASMTTGFCIGRILRDQRGAAIDLLFEMVNASFEILEGFPTATLTGKRLSEVRKDDPYFSIYADVADHKKKRSFTKHIALNGFILEVTCFSQDDDTIVFIESDETEKIKAVEKLQQAYKTIAEQNTTILSSIHYASKIQKNLLPEERLFQKAFADYSILWQPRDIVGGDVYWLKSFAAGTVLCVCDCTGHGTPGALLTMLAVSIFEDAVREENCMDTAWLLCQLDMRLANVLNVHSPTATARENGLLDIHDGCDLVALFIATNGSVSFSSANTPVLICNGKQVQRMKGQKLAIGDGKLSGPEAVKTFTVPANPENRFYIASDGVYDQIGETTRRPFGYKTVQEIILKHHGERLSAVSESIWQALETHRGKQPRRDDVQLISFQAAGIMCDG